MGGADQEDTGMLEPVTLRVQQVGGAMQRNSGLPGSRTTLNDDQAGIF